MASKTMLTLLIFGLVALPCHAEFRDPTQPAYPLPTPAATTDANGVDIGGEPQLVVSAIWISSRSRRATINGITVKEGQTLTIKQAPPPSLNPEPATPANTIDRTAATVKHKTDELLNMANAGTSLPSPGNSANPLGNMLGPLLSTAMGSLDLPQLQQQPGTMNTAASPPKQASPAHPPKTTHRPLASTTIVVVSIRKNSVIIEQNGELKTLHLVQPVYTTH